MTSRQLKTLSENSFYALLFAAGLTLAAYMFLEF